MKAALTARRSTTTDDAGLLTVIIPTRSPLLARLFLPVWLIGWSAGANSALRNLLSDRAPEATAFLSFWLLGWTIGGCAAVVQWLWMMWGREILTLDGRRLTLRRDILGLGLTREYDLADVRALRTAPVQGPYAWAWSTPWQGEGTIAFDHGARTVRFGGGIDEAEARMVVNELQAAHAFAA